MRIRPIYTSMPCVVAIAVTLGGLMAHPAAAQAPLGPANTDSPVTLQGKAGSITLDLSHQNDKSDPSVRIGYQSEMMSDQIKALRAKDAASALHKLFTYSFELRAKPSGSGSGSLFSGSTPSNNAQASLSLGLAYLGSSVPAKDEDVFREVLTKLQDIDAPALVQIQQDIADAAGDTDKQQKVKQRLIPIHTDIHGLQADSNAPPQVVPDAHGNTPNPPGDIPTLKHMLDDVKSKSTYVGNWMLRSYGQNILAYAEKLEKIADELQMTTDGKHIDPLPPQPNFPEFSSNPLYDQLYLRGTYRRNSATLYDSSKALDDQFTDQSSDTGSLEIGYSANFAHFVSRSLPAILGVSGGFARTDNLDSLPSIDVTDTNSQTSTTTQSSTNSLTSAITQTSTSTQRTTTDTQTALSGRYKRGSAGIAKADLVLFPRLVKDSTGASGPRSSIAVDFFGRFQGGTPAVYGTGFYITKPGAPTQVYGGLNAYRSERKKLAIDIVAGYPF